MSVVTVENRGPVSVIAINRPEKLNAINKAVAIELQQAFAEFDRSAQRIAVLTGCRRARVFVRRRRHRPAGAVALRADGRDQDRKACYRRRVAAGASAAALSWR